jgi:hypothetical protein
VVARAIVVGGATVLAGATGAAATAVGDATVALEAPRVVEGPVLLHAVSVPTSTAPSAAVRSMDPLIRRRGGHARTASWAVFMPLIG